MQKKIILVNDLSGFGRCSLTVWLPVISALGSECLLMPTSILSNHTAYPEFYLKDLKEDLDPWMETWNRLDVTANAIMSGYIASTEQAEKTLRLIEMMSDQNPVVICDPAMADQGKLYAGLDQSIVKAMRSVVEKSQLITPNITEACLLCGIDCRTDFSREEIEEIAGRLMDLGPDSVVITGIELADHSSILDCTVTRNSPASWIKSARVAKSRHGTGDIFSGVLAGLILLNTDLAKAVEFAGNFVRICLKEADRQQTPEFEGVPFECVLSTLTSYYQETMNQQNSAE